MQIISGFYSTSELNPYGSALKLDPSLILKSFSAVQVALLWALLGVYFPGVGYAELIPANLGLVQVVPHLQE